eukprot:12171983-Prorocentrum_lima.AAC.1
MTSSLVGSEMCIRDSLAIFERASPGGRWSTHPHSLWLLWFPPLLDTPVSYTHLTLPTICSV